MIRRIRSLLFASIAGVALWAPAAGQLPDEFTNLQVLPEDIATRELVGYMRGFAMGLGVRCSYCHMGEEGQPLSEYDFASDDKPTKVKARYMMTMAQEINQGLLAGLGDVAERRMPAVRVRCITCHRGVAVPRQIEEVIANTIADAGGAAGVARYRELRDEYHGSGSYDFGEQPLIEIASGQGDDAEAALAILELALEYYPESVQALVGTAQVHMAEGDNEAARDALTRAQELQPDNPQITRMLERIPS